MQVQAEGGSAYILPPSLTHPKTHTPCEKEVHLVLNVHFKSQKYIKKTVLVI